jgi:hypothetical protein
MATDLGLLGGFFAIVASALGVTARRRRSRAGSIGGAAASGSGSRAGPYRPAAAGTALDLAGRLLRSPWLWLGIGASVVLGALESRPTYPGALIVGAFQPLVLGLFVAVYVAVGRDRHGSAGSSGRQGPADPRTRTLGHLLGGTGVAGVLGAVCVVVVFAATGPGQLFDPWRPRAMELVQPLTAPMVIAAVAVAGARWRPRPAAAVPVLVVVAFPPFGWVLDLYHHTGRAGPQPEGERVVVTTGELAAHLVFLAGYFVFAAAVALLRHDRRPPVIALAVLSVLATGSGYALRSM